MAEPAEVCEVLLQTVDEGLSVPSEIARLAMYERIERSYQVKREEKLETFHQALRNLLGMRSAKVTEEVIAKNHYNRFGLNSKAHENRILVDYVKHTKNRQAGE